MQGDGWVEGWVVRCATSRPLFAGGAGIAKGAPANCGGGSGTADYKLEGEREGSGGISMHANGSKMGRAEQREQQRRGS